MEGINGQPVILVVLDGFGEAPNPDPRPKGNAIALANTPNYDKMREKHPFSLVEACGEAVGLVEGGMGGSEIGHFAIGAGRVVPQTLLQINWAIDDGSFFENPAISRAFRKSTKVSENKSPKDVKRLHVLGMLSDAGVHSHIDHLFALLDWVRKDDVQQCYIHIIGDGRDVASQSLMSYVKKVFDKIKELGLEERVAVGSLIGRFYAMDRDNNWKRTQTAYDLLTNGEGDVLKSSSFEAIDERVKAFYSSGEAEVSDYYLPPVLADKESVIREGDNLVFFNFRTDRPRQLAAAFEDEKFSEFATRHDAKKFTFVTFGPYSEKDNQEEAPNSAQKEDGNGNPRGRLNSEEYNIIVGFPTPKVKNNLGEWLSKKGIKQLRVAETEKYAHVTYFFNSQNDDPYEGEDREMIPSKKVKQNFAEAPAMSAQEITDCVVEKASLKKYPLIVVNYANADLVGHTGKLDPTIASVETLDQCLKALEEVSEKTGYALVITGDHGNAEDMFYEDGSEKMSHSMYPVIFMVANALDKDGNPRELKLKNGGLADVAPTVLELMQVDKASEMTGVSLIA